MSSLMRWRPTDDLVSFRDAMDRLFEDSFIGARSNWIAPLRASNLAIDMFDTKDQVVVKAALPGGMNN